VCISCGVSWVGAKKLAQKAATQHNCNKIRLNRELAKANQVITDAGALMTADDGFQWVDETKLPKRFVDYYAGLRSPGYALGAW
jgi:hypothetical protein